MKKWKQYLKIMKYGFNLKAQILLGGIFCAIGLFSTAMIGFEAESVDAGVLYLFLGSMVLIQNWFVTVNASRMIKAAPMRRAANTAIPALMQLVVSVVVFTAVVLIRVIGQNVSHIYCGNSLLICAGFIFLYLIYAGIAFKKMWLGTVFFLFAALGFFWVIGLRNIHLWESAHGPILGGNLALAIPAAYLIILAGAGINYLLLCGLYKLEMDKHVASVQLWKYMK